jgi:fructose-specific phosphotransferase system IIC component
MKLSYQLLVVVILGLMSMAASAVTYIDASASGIFTQIGADAQTLGGYAWTLMGIVLGISIAIGLTRRFLSKGAGR